LFLPAFSSLLKNVGSTRGGEKRGHVIALEAGGFCSYRLDAKHVILRPNGSGHH
jgi:hypothetical protein